MTNTHSSLSYSDERDKTYGVTGMAITLVVLDGEQYLTNINLDGEAAELIELSHDFGFKGNPRMSAKIVWEQTLKDLRLSASMAIGNVACRRYILAHKSLSREDTECLRSALRQDAVEHCGLDFDETDRLFDSCLSYVDRIFRHNGVADIANAFATRLSERRTLSGVEAVELLASLGIG